MTLAPGTRIGSYEITGAIGAGGMGEVFRARDTKLSRDVAIKVLPAEFADDPERVARFTREAQVLASLNHPNIAADSEPLIAVSLEPWPSMVAWILLQSHVVSVKGGRLEQSTARCRRGLGREKVRLRMHRDDRSLLHPLDAARQLQDLPVGRAALPGRL